ncbi:MAG: hypothetical protein AAFY64_01030 [Pseudomonadota bacterium]
MVSLSAEYRKAAARDRGGFFGILVVARQGLAQPFESAISGAVRQTLA